MPEEHFVLYLARLLFNSPHTLMPPSWLWPSGMRWRVELLGELVGSLSQVKEHCSPLPCVTRFQPPKDVLALNSHFDEATKLGLMGILGLAGPGAGWAKARLLRCRKCVEEDEAPDGYSFWRREHLLPGVLYCSKHQCPLMLPCDRCSDFCFFPAYTRHAGYHCGCGLKPIPEVSKLNDQEAEAEIEIARIAARLLNPSYLVNLDHEGYGNAIASRSAELGIVDNGRFRADDAIEVMKGSRFTAFFERSGLVVERSPSMARMFKGDRVPRNPLEAIAVYASLYPTWDEAEESFLVKPERPPVRPIVVKSDEELAVWRDRKFRWRASVWEQKFTYYAGLYADERKSHPKLSHVKLMRRLPTGATDFLTQERLAAAGIDVPDFMLSDSYYERLDEEFSAFIYERRKNLLATNCARQLTTAALIRGHRLCSLLCWHLPHLPKTKKALSDCRESHSEFRARMEWQQLPLAA
ncbi:hypothetical protein A9R05_21260 [Burkholderia sp. KK1]|nr:hypothetical protein A9R05_21260 [Burkholderia sp. KK1]